MATATKCLFANGGWPTKTAWRKSSTLLNIAKARHTFLWAHFWFLCPARIDPVRPSLTCRRAPRPRGQTVSGQKQAMDPTGVASSPHFFLWVLSLLIPYTASPVEVAWTEQRLALETALSSAELSNPFANALTYPIRGRSGIQFKSSTVSHKHFDDKIIILLFILTVTKSCATRWYSSLRVDVI